MPVRIRLQRFGRRNRPFYRVVVADSRAPRDGKFIELVGTYNPLATRSGIKEVTFNVDRARYWVSVGAQPSDRVAWLLGQFGILPPKVVPVARSMRTLPRKERKEIQKSLKGAKQFHTSTSLTALSQIETPSSPYELLPMKDYVSLPVGWGTGGLSGSTGAANAVTESGVESRWRDGTASIETGSTGLEISPNVLPLSLTDVLNSHLSLLGPTAVSRLSESPHEASGIGRINGSSRSEGSGTAKGFWENILKRFGWE